MPYIVRDLPSLIVATTSATVAGPIGHLDDASSITIFFQSSAATLSSGTSIQISQFDPADPFPVPGVTESSQFYTISTSNPTSTGTNLAVVISNVSFRGLQLSVLASANTAGEVIARVCKQISV